MLEQPKKPRKVYDRVREHQVSHDLLGLSEQEALEYAIMLSRDELVHSTSAGPSTQTDLEYPSSPEHHVALGEAVFRWDTDDVSSDYNASKGSDSDLIPISASSSSSANDDVYFSSSLSDSTPSTSAEGNVHFPPISGTTTPVKVQRGGSNTPSKISNKLSQSSAWNTPLKKLTGPSSPSVHNLGSSSSSPSQQGYATPAAAGEDFDNDLQLALELSLAEARSLGEA